MRINLATKFSLLVLAVLTLAVLSSSVALFSSWRLEGLFSATVNENLSSVRAAEELEIALLEQRGLVSSFILDDLDSKWLERLQDVEPKLEDWLDKARKTAHSDNEHTILNNLDAAYAQYDGRRQDVIRLCRAGNVSEATRVLVDEVQASYLKVYAECEEFLEANQQSVDKAVAQARQRVEYLTVILGVLAITTVISSGGLLWLFFGGVLLPLRRIVDEMRSFSSVGDSDSPLGGNQDELTAIREYLSTLMSDVAGARSTLELSQSQLAQAEKLASVGKLAASVAHEIRNPLTAMKMWLFSLRKSIGSDPDTDRKFGLISEELTRLESVVQNFLDFSRPPEVRAKPSSVAGLVEKTLELLGPRLAEHHVTISLGDLTQLPPVMADSEQIKQVLINLLVNAGEAMPEGGEIAISANPQSSGSGTAMVVLRIQDQGHGMSDDVRNRIFQPFFTTKEHGTGLGLCVAAQIIASHGGRLSLESTSSGGSCFAMWLPSL